MVAWSLLPIAGLLLKHFILVQGQRNAPCSISTTTTTTSSTSLPLQTAKPNIILIITDDQDVRTGTLEYMPKIQKALAEQGTNYERFYAPVSLCCPSRVSLLRAQYAHNHNITYVGGPYGGYHLFCEKGQNDAYLPVFLQEAGYNTYYTGKLMNGLSWDLIHSEYPKGWTYSDFLVDPNAYLYFNASFSANNTDSSPVSFEGQYQVDVVKDKALGLFQDALADSGKPFFLGIAPTAPHLEVQFDGGFTEPLPRADEASLFEDVIIPRSPSFNVKGQGAVSWLKDLNELNETLVDYIDHVYRQRLRVLQPVDDLVAAIVQAVEDAGPEVAENTYIIYTSDNGYALGSHQRNLGKTLPYEEDVLVPLLIRGPAIPKNVTNSEDVYTMPDLGASILGLAGASVDEYTLDGRVFLGSTGIEKPRHTLVEYWNGGLEEGIYAPLTLRPNTTYRSIRVDNWVYGVWCTGENELYDLSTDPYQLVNLAFDITSGDTNRVISRLNALMIVLKTCVGDVCRNPWDAIFTLGEAANLEEALDEKYDSYFDSLPRFRYRECRYGYFEDGASEYPTWDEGMSYSS
ncbi:hypothetical protein VNI00_012333 [Paramarasmius palmivorus]|uniref:Sulfatase N-terminal domain-containing protein n=1 Tax=Paramarasmius palmivorus TaxID=297713 RepID=A0AAW0C5P0_9AGAR